MKTPICPILLFFKGDENKCNTSNCNYNKTSRNCTMKCLKQDNFFLDNYKKEEYNYKKMEK